MNMRPMSAIGDGGEAHDAQQLLDISALAEDLREHDVDEEEPEEAPER